LDNLKQALEKIIELLGKIIAVISGVIADLPVVGSPAPTEPSPVPMPGPIVTPTPTPSRELIWSDEFTYGLGPQWHFFEGEHRDAVNTRAHARVVNDKLVMTAAPSAGGRKPRTSYLRTWNDKNMGDNPFLIDPTQGPIYIETSVKLDKAYGSQGAWWAFWLFAPDNWDNAGQKKWDGRLPYMEPYDGDARTGMEVDLFEYSPHLPTWEGDPGRKNGFNCAAFIDLEGGSKHMETPDGHGYMYDINNFIDGPHIDLTDGNFHKIGFRQTSEKYEFFIDGQKYWEITDPKFITTTRSNAIIMSWEIEDGLWGESGPKFNDLGKTVEVQVDYVRVYRENS